jgi:hypothetical protein
MNDAERARRVNAAHTAIMAAARRGAISPQSALRWARRAAAGEDVSIVASLAAPRGVADENRRALAASPTLAAQILDTLTAILDAVTGGQASAASDVPPEWPSLFPPGTWQQPGTMQGPGHYPAVNKPLVYDGGSQQPREVSWDGYTTASGPLPDDYSTEELHRELFGDGWYAGG